MDDLAPISIDDPISDGTEPDPVLVKSEIPQNPTPDLTNVTSAQNPPLDPTTVTSAQNPPPDPTSVTSVQNPPPDPTSVTSLQNPPPDPTSVTSVQNPPPPPPPDPTTVTSAQFPPPDLTNVSSAQNPPLDPTSVTSVQNPPLDPTPVVIPTPPPATVVTPVNHTPLVISKVAPIVLTPGVTFSSAVGELFKDEDGDRMSYGAVLSNGDPLPKWMVIDPDSGRINGSPPASPIAEELSIVVTATDSHGALASTSLAISIQAVEPVVESNHAPRQTASIRGTVVYANEKFSNLLGGVFVDDDGDKLSYSATLADGTDLPKWMTFDSTTGRVYGIAPDVASRQAVSLKITADDGHGGHASALATLMLINKTPVLATVTATTTTTTTTSVSRKDGGETSSGSEHHQGGKGKDNFIGDAGRDTYNGKGGADHFAFAVGDGNDKIGDFGKHGDHDSLNLSAWADESDLATFLSAHAHEKGHNLILDNGHGDQIILNHVQSADLTADTLTL